jgi:hypothetical protein|tara:strand:+ start:98 stop:1810 length:1713 start_codon:yes stop_codon:yes gene_type:complete
MGALSKVVFPAVVSPGHRWRLVVSVLKLAACKRGRMWRAHLLLALGSLPLAPAVGSAEKRVALLPLHGMPVRNATLNQHDCCEWEWWEEHARVDQHAYPHCGSRAKFTSNSELWRAPWDWREERAGIEQKRHAQFARCSEERKLRAPVKSTSIIAYTSSGRPFLFAVFLTMVVFAYGAARYPDSSDFRDSDGEREEGDGMAEESVGDAPPGTEDDMEDHDDTSLYEPISGRVAMTVRAHNPDRMVDLDALAGHTTARALLRHSRSATGSISDGGGHAVVLPPKVYLAVQWHPGSQRVWQRLQHDMSKQDWILATCETFMLFIRRTACPALFRLLPELGEFVGPACGKQAGEVAFKKRSRGAIVTTVLLAALEKLAVDQMDDTLDWIVYVTLGDRLPLAGYVLNEDGFSPMAPLGLSGARLLDYFGQHSERYTYLILADIAVHQPLDCNQVNDVVWPLYKKRARSDRITRPAVVDLRADDMDQYDQYEKDGGWMKLKITPTRRSELAAEAIDAHAVGARSVLRESRLVGAGIFWNAPVRCNQTFVGLLLPPQYSTFCRWNEWNKVAQLRRI